MPKLTTTSYVILGLLALRRWSTYELAQQMKRSIHYYWPRAESHIYEEPKKLVARGLAVASREQTGRRPRTVYAITDDGRAALRAWLTDPGKGPVVEFEGLVKVLFAVYGALRDGNQDKTEAAIVTGVLQTAIDNSPNGNRVVTINNANMGGDPAPGVQKHVGALVEVDGVPRPFACLENQTIDFS